MKKQVYECLPVYIDKKDGTLVSLAMGSEMHTMFIVAKDEKQAVQLAIVECFSSLSFHDENYDLDFLVRPFLE